MAQLLNEIFNIKNGLFKKKDGTTTPIAYIDPETSENTFKYKDEIKKFGAYWINSMKTWGWYTKNDPNVYQNKIKPCLEYLVSVEKNPDNESRDVISIIDRLIKEIESGVSLDTTESVGFDANEVKKKLTNFKYELMNCVSSEDFKQKMLPIIKFRNAQGHQYSLLNSILIYIQDPKATMVKSRTNWFKMNRIVSSNAPVIALKVPTGGEPLTQEQKEEIIQRFLVERGVSSRRELTPGDKEELRVRLKPKGKRFDLIPAFYDIRFTQQMKGKEDIVGDGKVDLPWFDDDGEETEETVQYCDAMIEVIKDRGIKVGYVDDMGGARGVSKSGAIDVLTRAKKNSGLFNTLVHEYAHELLHQRYVKNADDNPDGYGRFFIGKSQGRAVVEQQAELCAWVVLRNFGFDMKTNINYVGIWGMNEKSAPFVFDTVANVSTAIIKDIYSKID